MKIKINSNDVFRYVVGNTSKDPIESCIDFNNRYEVMDFGIFDHITKEILVQNSSFVDFCQAVSNLRNRSSQLSTEEIFLHCKNLSSVPIETNLG